MISLPEPDGSAEANKERHPEGGYTYDEVPAWSESLVLGYAAARVAEAVAAEREWCAKVCEELELEYPSSGEAGWYAATIECAAAIREGIAERDALRKNAERYRTVRSLWFDHRIVQKWHGEKLDAAIDAIIDAAIRAGSAP